MKSSRFSGPVDYVQKLLWSERAQFLETMRLYTILLFSISIIITIFGLLYYLIGDLQGSQRPLVECIYFVWITLTTIGFSDEGFASGAFIRIVTILVGTFLITRFIVLSAHVYARVVVEEVYNLKIVERMKKGLNEASGHFLIFGDDRELINKIIQGLIKTQDVYLVGDDREMIDFFHERYPGLKYIPGKPFSAETVDLLRPESSSGACTLFIDDEKNLLMAAMLENRTRVISRFSGNFSVLPRFRRVGVEPISPHFNGGLKVVSTMIRPKVTEFLDRYVFPESGRLEFRLDKTSPDNTGSGITLAAYINGRMEFGATPAPESERLVLGYRMTSGDSSRLGPVESPDLPVRTDRFLVLGGGTIGRTVIGETLATLREVTVVEPDSLKLEQLRQQFGDERSRWVVGNSTSSDYELADFDGVAIVTPKDEMNFAIGLDFMGTPLQRVVRAVDDDMEQHYRRIGAVPVFAGRVGAARMLREVTNRLSNEVLTSMLQQNYRLDEVYLSQPMPPSEVEERFQVRLIAVCRERVCYFGADPGVTFLAGDTLIICGHVENNKKLRMHNRVEDML